MDGIHSGKTSRGRFCQSDATNLYERRATQTFSTSAVVHRPALLYDVIDDATDSIQFRWRVQHRGGSVVKSQMVADVQTGDEVLLHFNNHGASRTIAKCLGEVTCTTRHRYLYSCGEHIGISNECVFVSQRWRQRELLHPSTSHSSTPTANMSAMRVHVVCVSLHLNLYVRVCNALQVLALQYH